MDNREDAAQKQDSALFGRLRQPLMGDAEGQNTAYMAGFKAGQDHASGLITALRKRVSDLERERQAVIERIPMEYLQAHDAPGATSVTASFDLPAAMKAYSEARWRLIERLKAAESAALKED